MRGPPDENEYYLERDRLDSDEYHDIARETTQKVLTACPRNATKVRVRGEPDLLREYVNEAAVELLADAGATVTGRKAGIGPLTVSTEQLRACLSATPEVVEAVLSLFSDPLWHAHFFDEKEQGIAARYDGTMQHYWLPEQTYETLAKDLSEDVTDAIVTR